MVVDYPEYAEDYERFDPGIPEEELEAELEEELGEDREGVVPDAMG